MSEPASDDGKDPVRSVFADDVDFREILCMFTETILEKQKSLCALYRDGSVEQVRVLAHQLKGSGGGYGFPGLSAAAAELEQACKAQDASQIARTIDALVEYLRRIEI